MVPSHLAYQVIRAYSIRFAQNRKARLSLAAGGRSNFCWTTCPVLHEAPLAIYINWIFDKDERSEDDIVVEILESGISINNSIELKDHTSRTSIGTPTSFVFLI